MSDIEAVNDVSRIARRTLDEIKEPRLLTPEAGWDYRVEETRAGFPSVTMFGPIVTSDGRRVTAQVEPPGRGSDPARFQASIGIEIWLKEFESEEARTATMPRWVEHARLIGEYLEESLEGTVAELSTRAAQGGQEHLAVKMSHVSDSGLPRHYAKGYIQDRGGYLGVKTKSVEAERLKEFMEELEPALRGVVARFESRSAHA